MVRFLYKYDGSALTIPPQALPSPPLPLPYAANRPQQRGILVAMNRVDRLFGILLRLQRHRRVRAQDLARHFEVSERTIYRDIAALNELGVPIISLPNAGYELPAGFSLPPLFFTSGEAAPWPLRCSCCLRRRRAQSVAMPRAP